MPDSFEFFRLFIHPWGFGNLGPEILIFFSLKNDSVTLKTHFILLWGVSKTHFSCPLHIHCFRNIHPIWECLVLFQKYPSTMRAACAISEIYSTMRGLCYFRNNHPLWEWLALFQKYPPTMRWAAVRGGIGDSSSCMKIDFFLCKIRFRTHRIII